MVPKIGELIENRYKVTNEIGRGGMGVVFAANDEKLGRRVAIKVLSPGLLTKIGRQRFEHEARIAGSLENDHTVRVYDVGELDDGSSPYLVMELLRGQSLEKILNKRGRLPAEEVVHYVLQASVALAAMHAKGIIHRDLKPANLFLHESSQDTTVVKVLDFGIAKALDGAVSLTHTHQPIGTPQYMAPEQIAADTRIGVGADIWGLGVISYELLVGAPPFVADTLHELQRSITTTPPISPASREPTVPRELAEIVLRCLEKAPSKRYRNLAELGQDLLPWGTPAAARLASRIADELGVTIHLPSFTESAPAVANTPVIASPAPLAPTIALFAGMALLVAACVLAIFLLRMPQPGEQRLMGLPLLCAGCGAAVIAYALQARGGLRLGKQLWISAPILLMLVIGGFLTFTQKGNELGVQLGPQPSSDPPAKAGGRPRHRQASRCHDGDVRSRDAHVQRTRRSECRTCLSHCHSARRGWECSGRWRLRRRGATHVQRRAVPQKPRSVGAGIGDAGGAHRARGDTAGQRPGGYHRGRWTDGADV